MNLIVITSLLIFAAAFGYPESEICTEEKINEFWDDVMKCTEIAKEQFREDMVSGLIPYKQALCNLIVNYVKCGRANYEMCYDDKMYEFGRLEYLKKEYVHALKSDNLGKDFVDSCPIFEDFKVDYMIHHVGSLKCDFETYNYRALAEKRACDMKVSYSNQDNFALARFMQHKTSWK